MVKRLHIAILGLSLAILGPISARAGDIIIDKFGGLNTQDNPITLAPDESQDLLNVNVTPGGGSVSKRKGFGLYKSLPINTSTTSVHGGYHFQNTSGDDVQLWGNDIELVAIVNGADPVAVATGTVSSTWQCTDSQGSAYCFNTSRNYPVKTDGSTTGTSYTPIPQGMMGAFTPDRLVVAGVSGGENSLYFSEANQFTSFTVGVAENSPWIEVLASPGSRITHIRYACGKLLYWKDQSFGYVIGTNQFDTEVGIIQSDIGTLDNSSAYSNGHVWFRGQDNHIYDYDCSNLTRLSRSITPTVGESSRRKSNSWTLDTQADFGTGVSSWTGGLSTTINPGSLTVSTISRVDTSSADFSAGNYTLGIDTNTAPNNLYLTVYSSETFASGLGVFVNDAGCASDSMNVGGKLQCDEAGGTCCANLVLPVISSDVVAQINVGEHATGGDAMISVSSASSNMVWRAAFNNGDTTVRLCKTGYYTISCGGADVLCSASVSGAINPDNLLGLVAYSTGTIQLLWNGVLKCSASSLGNLPTFTTINLINRDGGGVRNYIDNAYVRARAGSFTSSVKDMQFVHPIYGTLDYGAGIPNSSTSVSLFYRCSSDTVGGYTGSLPISSGSWITNCTDKRYFVYTSTLATSNALYSPILSSVTIVSASTGTYFSAVHQAPALTITDLFTAQATLNDGALTYYTRTSMNSYTMLSATPAWVAQPINAQIAASTGTYIQAKVDFGITAGTQAPTLDSLTFNWIEGNALDKAYIEFFDDDVWISVSSGTVGTNNRILRWDTLNSAWMLDDIPVNGFVVDKGKLYLGSPSIGAVYQFGSVPTDAGASINAYWKSKNFVGADLWVANEYKSHDFIIKASTAALTVTYELNTSSAISYGLNIYSPTMAILRRGKNLPTGAIGTFYNIKFGDDSSYEAWEVFGHRARYVPLPWRPQ